MAEMTRPNLVRDERCPFCESQVPELSRLKRYGDLVEVPCSGCGTYLITGSAIDVLPHWDLDRQLWGAIAYQVRRMTGRSEPPRLDTNVLRALREAAALPHPDQILDDFVLWLGSNSRWPGYTIDLQYQPHHTLLGATAAEPFNYMLRCIARSPLFAGDHEAAVSAPGTVLDCALTPDGWQHFRKLSTSKASRRDGFMAMKYGDEQVDAVVQQHFAPEVERAGFALRRLDQGQPAGLIDDQLRVRIRQAKFLVCDLTHGNRGAYWEAGFAEGLGIPVIYSCRRDVFEDSKHEHHPHFDAAHWVTVPWEPDNPAPAAAKLKAIVRATLPSEAKLQD